MCLTITRISVENIEILAIRIILYLRICSFSSTVFVIIIVIITLCNPQNFEKFCAKISLRIRVIRRASKLSVDSPFMKFSRSDKPLKLLRNVRDLN